LPLAAEGVQRYVWEGKFGAILVETRGDRVYVNGQEVEPAEQGLPLEETRAPASS